MFQSQGKLVNSIEELLESIGDYETVRKREWIDGSLETIKYINLPCSFDIEVSSFRVFDKKASIMYIWQFGIDGYVTYGRTWQEFDDAMEKVRKHFHLGFHKRLPVYVHNLAYEFQFIQHHFTWRNIFARELRQPLRALTDTGIEYRCSLALSGCSLEQTCKDLVKYKVAKKVGDLDYELLRTPHTKLSAKELDYCIYDVICVMNYIKEEMEHYDNNIVKIPMTKTGKVREACRAECFSEANKKAYHQLMKALQINDLDEYDMLKDAFQGGFTHASILNCYFTHNRVYSRDFTSSYPTVMISERYPMSRGEEYHIRDEKDLIEKSKNNLLIFNVHFTGLRSKITFEHYLSASKCWTINSENKRYVLNEKRDICTIDNGRVVDCEECYTTITNVDWEIISRVYEWDEVNFGRGYIYRAGYLPTPFVKCVLDFYEKKTTLKDVVGMEAEYQLAKANTNSCYGMTVTDIINDLIEYETSWERKDGDMEEQLHRYNNSKKRFLFYPWGVFVTAWARRNLWTGILELKEDYIYSDTDSVKYLNDENHKEYFDRYNEWILNKLTTACEYHKISVDRVMPKTIKGKCKPLGVWDDEANDTPEGHLYARRFKTLGAKRYLIEYWNDQEEHWALKCTIAGVNKKKTSKWFMEDYENAFDKFSNFMEVPEEYSGRLIATYLDDEDAIEADITDYQGTVYHMEPNSGINMEKSSYNLTMTNVYLMLLGAREEVLTC